MLECASRRDNSQPLTRSNCRGIWPALIVPWTETEELDESRLVAEIRAYDGHGVRGVYTGGTTGEFYALDDATFDRLAEIACCEGHAMRLPVQIGCTALSTRVVCKRIRSACKFGADAIQVALPSWLALHDDEVCSFFADVAKTAGETPIFFYHSGRAKRRLTADLIGQLVDSLPTLIGMKDTICAPSELGSMLRAAPDLAVFGGEHDLVEKMQIGGRGAFTAMTGLNAEVIVRLYELCASGRLDAAQPLQQTIKKFYFEFILATCERERLEDAAIDRVMRVAGGVDVGLHCARPYRPATQHHVDELVHWCQQNAPIMLPKTASPFLRQEVMS